MAKRSPEPINTSDLRRLYEIARSDLDDYFNKKELGQLYADRLICIALCQGAALHYLDSSNGVKDFDVWSFFAEYPERPFPWRRHVRRDFGPSKFGRYPGDKKLRGFDGRNVDLFGRSLPEPLGAEPITAMQRYLAAPTTPSAHFLAQKAVVLLWPDAHRGTVVWPADPFDKQRI
jgi:hypothetical protein